ncbi:hypothetical protein ACFSQ7_50465 [Paenibacillus rhizoplanae]
MNGMMQDDKTTPPLGEQLTSKNAGGAGLPQRRGADAQYRGMAAAQLE